MLNALAGKQPLDNTLTNLSGKDVAGLLTYLGLGEGSALPVGVPVPWPSATPPTGWLKCNGAAFSAEEYPELAKAYPTNKLPDLRGEFIRGWDDGRGIDAGRVLLSIQTGMLEKHRHPVVANDGYDSKEVWELAAIFRRAYTQGKGLDGIKTLPSVTAAVTRTSSALSWLAGAPLALLRRGLASSGNAAGLLTAPLSSLRRTASLTGHVLKTVAGAPVALLRSGLSGLRAVAVMFMNPLAALRGGLIAAGAVLRVLASGPLAMLRVALYAVSGLLGALLSPIGLVVTALAGVALVVWKYWQPITAFLGGVVEGFKAAAGPISAAFEPLKPVFQWIGDKVQALWGWFTDLLTPVKSTSAELQSAAAMGRRFGEALAEGLNMVMHPLDSLKSGVSWLLEKLGIVSKEAAKAKLPESVTRQQPATVNADGKVMMPSGGFPSWGYGFAGMYDSGGYIPRGQFGIVGENGPEIVNGPANVTSRRNTAALAAVVAGMMGVAAAPAELPPLHPLALPAKGGEAMVSRAATVPPAQRIEAPTQIIIQTQPGQSAQDIAREVARQLDERERRLKAKARSNYSDQGGYDA